MILMHLHRHGCWGLNDALVCCWCLATVHANNAVVRTAGGVVCIIFSVFAAVLTKEGEGKEGGRSGSGGRPPAASLFCGPRLLFCSWPVFPAQAKALFCSNSPVQLSGSCCLLSHALVHFSQRTFFLQGASDCSRLFSFFYGLHVLLVVLTVSSTTPDTSQSPRHHTWGAYIS